MAIAGGGTAGHVCAGLAIAAAYRDAVEDLELVFVGTRDGLESRLVPPSGNRLELVPGSPLAREGPWGATRALGNLARGSIAARRLLAREQTRLLIGLGGYASAGMLLAARSLGIPIVVHEANVEPGITHRWLGRLAERVYLGFPAAQAAFPRQPTRVTGNPIQGALSPTRGTDPLAETRQVVVTGGSRGSRFLDRHVPALLSEVAARGVPLSVLHQTGDGDPAPVREAYTRCGLEAQVLPFIDDMAQIFQRAHFAISCAGALTLAELSAAGLPALLVPLAASAGDHQARNARAYAEATGAWWLREENWAQGPIATRIAELLRSAEVWTTESKRMNSFAQPDAARTLVADCERLMQGRW